MSPLTSDVTDFIRRHIDSVAALQVLLLLKRSPDTFWAPAAVADQVGISAENASCIVERLHGAGLLARASGSSAFRFAPGDAVDRQCVESLYTAWAQTRSAVLATVHSDGPSSQTTGPDVRA